MTGDRLNGNDVTAAVATAATLAFGELADAYMLAYRGRDPGRARRIEFWKAQSRDLLVIDERTTWLRTRPQSF